MGPSGRITHVIRYIAYIGLFGTGKCRFIQVLYLGRAPRTKETLPDFSEKCRVTRHSRVFRRLTGSQRTPRFWGITAANMAKVRTFEIGLKLSIRGRIVGLRLLDMDSMVGTALTIEREIKDARSTQDAGVSSKRKES